MIKPPIPINEKARTEELAALKILDTDPEQEFDSIVKLASEICGVPVALVSLIDESRQWFKAKVGLAASETPREVAFCAHAILDQNTMVVPNAKQDPRFADNPLVLGAPNVEFYAGVPLRTSSGHAIGTLCVIDHVPRSLSEAQKASLEALAAQVVRLLELRRATILQRSALASLDADQANLRSGLSEGEEKGRGWSRLAIILCGLFAAASLLASLWVYSTVSRSGAARLASSGDRAATFLQERVHAYGEILRGAGALFRASEHVAPHEFRAYVEGLELARNFPGLLGLGYTERVSRDNLAEWLREVQREIPDFQVNTKSTEPGMMVVNKYIEPLAENRLAVGFDIASEPTRAEALARSLSSKDLALSTRVTLLQDPNHGPGFVMYLPVPSQNKVGQNVGWVFAALRARDLLAGIQQAAGKDVALRLSDSPNEAPLLDGIKSDDLMYRRDVEMADRSFVLEVMPSANFFSWLDRLEPWTILFLGLAMTVLIFALTTSMRRTQARSRALAVRMTDALRRGEREMRAIVENTTDFIITFAEDGRLILRNSAFRSMLGYSEQDFAHMTIFEVIAPGSRAAFEDALKKQHSSKDAQRIETVFRANSGATIEVEGALSFVDEGGGRVTRAIFRDVSSRRQTERALMAANQALESLATTDSLTGVANRRAFDERLVQEILRAKRNNAPLSIALLDVDCFKFYNDHYGHLQGDECLRKIGNCMAGIAKRSTDLAARYGGEEFVLLIPETDGIGAYHLADQLRQRIAKLQIPHERNPHSVVTASLGVACFDPSVMATGNDLVAAADAALYRAKSMGRNRVERASPPPVPPTPGKVSPQDGPLPDPSASSSGTRRMMPN